MFASDSGDVSSSLKPSYIAVKVPVLDMNHLAQTDAIQVLSNSSNHNLHQQQPGSLQSAKPNSYPSEKRVIIRKTSQGATVAQQ